MKYQNYSLRQIENKKARKKRIKTFLFCFLVFTLLINCIFSYILTVSKTKITAHRGSSIFSPENTIASVIEAIALNVDYIEIDVQLSKDEKVILLHDSTFKRTAGVKISPWQLTYEEILALNVGNYKSDPFVTSAPLLEEVLNICPKDITLNIELKDYGHSQNLPQKVVSLIEEYDFVNNCVISSTSMSILRTVYNLNSQIKVGLITSSPLISSYYGNNFLDFYSISYTTLSPTLTAYLHSKGKEVYCWAPNSKIAISLAIHQGVDNIITDKVSLAKLLIVSNQ